MNGTFTEAESRHLSADERLHYVELGLCAPVGRGLLSDMLAEEKEKCTDLQGQLDEANETAGALQSDFDEFRSRVRWLAHNAPKLRYEEVLERLVRLLD